MSMTTRFIERPKEFEYFYLDGMVEGGAWRDVIQFCRPVKGNGAWVYEFTVRVHRENLHECASLRFADADPYAVRCRYSIQSPHYSLDYAQRLWERMVSDYGFVARSVVESEAV